MRLWSISPKYLDSKGLVALWREGLLAQKVLDGLTKGYRNHPQLTRFKDFDDPACAVAQYLRYVYEEALKRGYNFDADKLKNCDFTHKIKVTEGQLRYELMHLLTKLKTRAPGLYTRLKSIKAVEKHPAFEVIDGDVESWEIITKRS